MYETRSTRGGTVTACPGPHCFPLILGMRVHVTCTTSQKPLGLGAIYALALTRPGTLGQH